MESYNGNGWAVKRRLLPVRFLDDVFLFANARAVKRIAASAKENSSCRTFGEWSRMTSLAHVPWKPGETVRQTAGDASRKVWGEAVKGKADGRLAAFEVVEPWAVEKKNAVYKGLCQWHYKKVHCLASKNKSDRSRFV